MSTASITLVKRHDCGERGHVQIDHVSAERYNVFRVHARTLGISEPELAPIQHEPGAHNAAIPLMATGRMVELDADDYYDADTLALARAVAQVAWQQVNARRRPELQQIAAGLKRRDRHLTTGARILHGGGAETRDGVTLLGDTPPDELPNRP